MTRQIFVANALERQVLNLYPLTKVAGAVRLGAFWGLYSAPQQPVQALPPTQDASDAPVTLTQAPRDPGKPLSMRLREYQQRVAEQIRRFRKEDADEARAAESE